MANYVARPVEVNGMHFLVQAEITEAFVINENNHYRVIYHVNNNGKPTWFLADNVGLVDLRNKFGDALIANWD